MIICLSYVLVNISINHLTRDSSVDGNRHLRVPIPIGIITVSVCLSVSLSDILHVKIMVNLPYGTYCELQSDCKLKVMVPNKMVY